MDNSARIHHAMLEMCNNPGPLNDVQPQWWVADIHGLLREACFEELDALCNQALTQSLVCRDAELRYLTAWTSVIREESDFLSLVDAGPEGLALIYAWQQACPHSTHAWLAEVCYWGHWSWMYRSYGWARETTPVMWRCASACNEKMTVAVLHAIDRDPRQWLAAAYASTNTIVFSEPRWLKPHLKGKDISQRIILGELAQHHRVCPEEVEAMMAWSGLSFTDTKCGHLPRPAILPDYANHTSRTYWFNACLSLFPTAFEVIGHYIPFIMPRWRGSYDEIKTLLNSPACSHLTTKEHEHLELLFWWDEYRDLRIDSISTPDDKIRYIERAKEIALSAHDKRDRYNALWWLILCHSDLDDEKALWHYIQFAVMEKMPLNDYFTSVALKYAVRDFADGAWIRNFVCQNSVRTEFHVARIYRGYFQFAGLFGFEKDEKQGIAWLDSVSSIKHNHDWSTVIDKLRVIVSMDAACALAELGAQRNIPTALRFLGNVYDDNDADSSLPHNRQIALTLFKQQVKVLLEFKAHRDSIAYPLVTNSGYTFQEKDLRNAYYSVASCSYYLAQEETDPTLRSHYEKEFLDNIYFAHQFGHEDALRLFLLNSYVITDFTHAHPYLDFILNEGNKGTPEAMTALSRLYGNKKDKKLYNMKLSARWAHFLLKLYPENDLLMELIPLHFLTIGKKFLFALRTFRISDSELPGQINNMV